MSDHLGFSDKIGIMDPEGKNNNPLTQEPYSDRYRQLSVDPDKGWSFYPAYDKAKEILKSLHDNQLTLIISGTGSGKTVLLPKFALHYTNYKGKVAITLPKKSATASAAEFAALTLDVPIGNDIGYVHRGSPKEAISQNTKMIYMTDGTLVAKQIRDKYLSEYDVIIIDEAHERKVQIDFILLFLKGILESGKRPDLRVIIMSATIDGKKYQNYFSGIKSHIINISGKPNYDIDVKFLDHPITNYMKEGPLLIETLLNEGVKEDILFFITASEEAKKLCKMIRPKYPKVYCIEVFSDMDPKLRLYATDKNQYHELGNYDLKMVMATNVAESSLTIDGLKYVIDSCHEYHNSYDPYAMGYVMEKKLITEAQALQRRGRVGRTEPGTCYHLLTKKQFDALEKYPAPDILEQDITIDLLGIIKTTDDKSYFAGIESINKLMDVPKKKILEVAYDLYKLYHVIDANGILTHIGSDITEFSTLKIQQSLFLIYSYQMFCAKEASIIVTMIEILKGNFSNLFYKSSDDNDHGKASKQILKKIIVKDSDHLSFLKIFKEYADAADKKKWANKYGIRLDIMNKVKTDADKYYYRIINISKAYQEARVADVAVEIRLIRALRRSHDHMLAENLTPIYPTKKNEGEVSKNSVVNYSYTKKDLARKRFIYDELIQTNGNWEFSCVTLIGNTD
uniref:Helicase ATP-binding domain-containing protein n=1 Tax=viral metagenome TaxID=1070528 RepID=A0A6C0C9X6_9ZZZZ